MKRIENVMWAAVLTLSCALGAGCSKAEVKYSGFLDGYDLLQPAPSGGVAMSYRKQGVDFSKYNQIMLDPILVWYSAGADYKGISPDDLKAMTDYFRQAIIKAVGDAYPVVEKPGPGVLRVRIAITDLQPTKPALNTITSLTPAGLVLGTGAGAAGYVPPGVGEAGIEAEFLDSATNQQVAIFVDRKVGKKYDIVQGTTTWGQIQGAFDEWAKLFRQRLDEARGILPYVSPLKKKTACVEDVLLSGSTKACD